VEADLTGLPYAFSEKKEDFATSRASFTGYWRRHRNEL
jgi:hypothetical protein